MDTFNIVEPAAPPNTAKDTAKRALLALFRTLVYASIAFLLVFPMTRDAHTTLALVFYIIGPVANVIRPIIVLTCLKGQDLYVLAEFLSCFVTCLSITAV
jgi:hypothetical protein